MILEWLSCGNGGNALLIHADMPLFTEAIKTWLCGLWWIQFARLVTSLGSGHPRMHQVTKTGFLGGEKWTYSTLFHGLFFTIPYCIYTNTIKYIQILLLLLLPLLPLLPKPNTALHRCRAVRTALFQQQLHHLLGALMFHRLRPATCRDGSRNVKTWRLTFKVHFGCRTVH